MSSTTTMSGTITNTKFDALETIDRFRTIRAAYNANPTDKRLLDNYEKAGMKLATDLNRGVKMQFGTTEVTVFCSHPPETKTVLK